MDALITKIVDLGINGGVSGGITAIFILIIIKFYNKSLKNSFTSINEKYKILSINHDKDIDNIKSTFKELKCVEVTQRVNDLASEVKVFIRLYQRVVKEHDNQLHDLFGFKSDVIKDIAIIKETVKNKKFEMDLRSFKQKYFGLECLLVEDKKDTCEMMADVIKDKLGFRVKQAFTLADAIAIVDNEYVDCAIVDFNLDTGTALDFFDHCKFNSKLLKCSNGGLPQVKAVIYTGDDTVTVPIGYPSLTKPINWDKMISLLECVLEK